ncbi:hypothetical protein AAFX91_41430 [Bradyrhizobium sp. 31Argb]|nr:hypothetical protein [Bradyrhizobium sp. Leo170]
MQNDFDLAGLRNVRSVYPDGLGAAPPAMSAVCEASTIIASLT